MGLLDPYEFGRGLLDTLDLDPVYVFLWEAARAGDISPEQLRRWLLAYWCFYHSGTASWVTDQRDFGAALVTAAGFKDYPRCHERRHFRGAFAVKAATWLVEHGAEELLEEFDRAGYEGRALTATEVMDYAREWYGFGPWIAFKVADMVERLGLCRVTFDLDTVLYDSPRKGAELMRSLYAPGLDAERAGPWAVEQLCRYFTANPAPPRGERPFGLQEAETVLCKWKSYRGGHYHLGEDVIGSRKGLLWAARCRTAQALLKAGKRGGLWA